MGKQRVRHSVEDLLEAWAPIINHPEAFRCDRSQGKTITLILSTYLFKLCENYFRYMVWWIIPLVSFADDMFTKQFVALLHSRFHYV